MRPGLSEVPAPTGIATAAAQAEITTPAQEAVAAATAAKAEITTPAQEEVASAPFPPLLLPTAAPSSAHGGPPASVRRCFGTKESEVQEQELPPVLWR